MVDALDVVLDDRRAASDQVAPDESLLLSTAKITVYKAPGWLRGLFAGAQPPANLRSWILSAGAFAVGFVLFLGLAALLRPPAPALPSMEVSLRAVRAGQAVRVAARQLPRNQTVQIYVSGRTQAIAKLGTGPSGSIVANPVIPADTKAGPHQLKLCWGSNCPLFTQLTVMGLNASPTPRPTPKATPRATPTPRPAPTPPDVPPSDSMSGSGATADVPPSDAGLPTPRPTVPSAPRRGIR
jgi:hypothetical protein